MVGHYVMIPGRELCHITCTEYIRGAYSTWKNTRNTYIDMEEESIT